MTNKYCVIVSFFALALAGCRLCVAGQQPGGTLPTTSCSQDARLRAESASDKIRSWSALRTYHGRYSNCPFDADAAEGLSESIGWLLLNRWDTVPQKALASDRFLRAYVLGGVNSTLDRKTLEQILEKSKGGRCAGIAASFCKDLRKRVTQALTEQP